MRQRSPLGVIVLKSVVGREGAAPLSSDDRYPSTSAMVLGTDRRQPPPLPPAVTQPIAAVPHRWPGLAAAVVGLGLATVLVWQSSASQIHAGGPSAGARASLVAPASAPPPVDVANVLPSPASARAPASPPSSDARAERTTASRGASFGRIRVAVAGHRVFIDGRYAGDGAGTYVASPGRHRVRVGSVGKIRTLDIPRGGEVVIESTGFQADVVPDAQCAWQPYEGAWACALPRGFELGRLDTPPSFRQDPASTAAREHAWEAARSRGGARSAGHVGAFVPAKGGAWLFVPGSAWSPSDPVYLPRARAAKGR